MFGFRIQCLLMPLTLLSFGCTTEKHVDDATLSLGVDVRADSGQGQVLDVSAAPGARIWVARVAPARMAPADPQLPDAPQDTVIPAAPAPPMLEIDDDLKAPILRHQATLRVPSRYARSHVVESVELDVRIDEGGDVTDALWAAGVDDSVLVEAATECALAMKFYPAMQAGRPVPVWCRQRFDFGGGAPKVAP